MPPDESPGAGPPDRASALPEPWMGLWLADAERAGDVMGACTRAGISILEYRAARARCYEFDQACLIVDTAVRLAAVSALEAKAANGDVQAARLLLRERGALAELRADLAEPSLADGPVRVVNRHGVTLEYPGPEGLWVGGARVRAWTPHAVPRAAVEALEEAWLHVLDLVGRGDPISTAVLETVAGERCFVCGHDPHSTWWWEQHGGGLSGWSPPWGACARPAPVGADGVTRAPDPPPPPPVECPSCRSLHYTRPMNGLCICGTMLPETANA